MVPATRGLLDSQADSPSLTAAQKLRHLLDLHDNATRALAEVDQALHRIAKHGLQQVMRLAIPTGRETQFIHLPGSLAMQALHAERARLAEIVDATGKSVEARGVVGDSIFQMTVEGS